MALTLTSPPAFSSSDVLACPLAVSISQDPADYDGKCPVNKEEYYEPPVCQVDAGKGMYGQPTDFTSSNDFAQMRVPTKPFTPMP